MKITMGIDTSCYTTSIALMDNEGELKYDGRRLLQVARGKRGLQQSEGVFQHLHNIPALLEQGKEYLKEVDMIVVSSCPRSQRGSYMPVFTVGHNFARTLAVMRGIPLLESDHQTGHLLAGFWSAGIPKKFPCLGVHLSGGTTEFLYIEEGEGSQPFKISLIGGTSDLHAGQFVDRVGVALGLPFPAGQEMENLANRAKGEYVEIPSFVRRYQVSFSGPESHAQRLIMQGIPAEIIAYGVLACIAKTVEKVLRALIKETGMQDILFVGGVAANGIIRQRLRQRLEHRSIGARLFFADSRYSSDNAVGLASFGFFNSRFAR